MAGIIFGVVALAFAVFQQINFATERRETYARHELALEADRAERSNLLAQVQANAQGLQFYPSLPPRAPEAERHIVRDDTGLIEYDATNDDDFVHVSGIGAD